MKLNNINGIIFDVHRTLVDDTGFSRERIWRLIQESGVKLDMTEYYQSYDNLTKKMFNWAEINPFITIRQVHTNRLEIIYNRYNVKRDIDADIDYLLKCMGTSKIYPEVPKILNSLSTRYPISLLSNADNDDPLIQILLDNNFSFNTITTSEQVNSYKPNPEIFASTLDKMGLKHDEVIMIGDSPVSDICGAKNAGIKIVWINRKKEKLGMEWPVPDYQISNLTELLDILES